MAVNQSPMKEMLALKKEWTRIPYEGDILKGSVIGKESGTLYIDLGPIGTGVIYGREYFAVQENIRSLKSGDKVIAKLIELENEKGLRELSMKEAGEEKNWQSLKELRDNKENIEVVVIDANRGGLLVQTGDMNGFLPVSQLAPANYPRVEGGNKDMILEELRKFVGEKIKVRVLDVNPQEGSLIFSERAAEDEKIKSDLSNFKVGDIVEGTITGVVDFGAFMKFAPLLEGLIHISAIDWNLVKNPNEVLKVGEKIKAKIVDITEDGRISLSIKELKKDPWQDIENRLKIEGEIKGEVSSITSYGALIKIGDGVQGLAHISDFASEEQMKKELQPQKSYTFKITSIDAKERKISLSLASK